LADGVKMKIEVTPVFAGVRLRAGDARLPPRVEDEYGFAEIQVVSFPDLYAGKLVAALDRQHPRSVRLARPPGECAELPDGA